MADDLMLPELDELVQLLRSAGLKADMDPDRLNLPGAWVAVDTVDLANVKGDLRLGCLVYLVSHDTDQRRAMGVLSGMYRKVLTVLSPDGQVRTQGVVMPGDPTPLPALRVPVNVYTESE